MDVREKAIDLICVLYQQLGEIVQTIIEQGDLNELLLKKVTERLKTTSYKICLVMIDRYDPSLSKQYTQTSTPAASTQASVQVSVQPPAISLSDLIEQADVTSEVEHFYYQS